MFNYSIVKLKIWNGTLRDLIRRRWTAHVVYKNPIVFGGRQRIFEVSQRLNCENTVKHNMSKDNFGDKPQCDDAFPVGMESQSPRAFWLCNQKTESDSLLKLGTFLH